jgi:drug/metabolite transporter (DMT)-like permease
LVITKQFKRMTWQDLWMVSLLGVCGYGLASICTLYGLKSGGVTNFALMAAYIVLGYFLEAFVFVLSRKFKNRTGTFQYLAVCQLSAALLVWIL